MYAWILGAALALAAPQPQEPGAPPVTRPVRSVPRVKVGDPLPALELVAPDGSPVQLGSRRTPGRPLVLIFGSFT